MRRAATTTLTAVLFLAFLILPGRALAFEAGLRAPQLGDPAPGAISVPFEIPIRQSEAVPQPLDFEIAVEGFSLDPAAVRDLRIGSLDLVTDSGDFDDKPIFSNGLAIDGVRTWTLDWQLGEKPITARVEDGVALDPSGERIANPEFTLIIFTVPGNYHGFRLMGLGLRFNQEDHGLPTPGVGAVNPLTEGSYLLRSRITSVDPPGEVSVTSARVEIGNPRPATSLSVTANRSRVHPGGKVRFTLRTTNGTSDTVEVWLAGRRIRTVKVGSKQKRFSWKAPRKLAGRKAAFAFTPGNGVTRRLAVKVRR